MQCLLCQNIKSADWCLESALRRLGLNLKSITLRSWTCAAERSELFFPQMHGGTARYLMFHMKDKLTKEIDGRERSSLTRGVIAHQRASYINGKVHLQNVWYEAPKGYRTELKNKSMCNSLVDKGVVPEVPAP
jgi:hypothetical protein